MDRSIFLITPDMHRARGADAFDEGRGVDAHDMNAGAPAIKDWQYGWHARRIERSRPSAQLAAQQSTEAAAA